MGLGHSPAIVSEGLVFYFDPINTRSYAGTGLTGFNLIDTNATGSLVGGAVYDVANRGSIFLDGVNDYINFATQPISDNNSISISCWVKFATIPSTFTPIIDAGNVGVGTSGYCISFDNARKIYMAVNGGFTNINFNFNTNTWYHITGTAQQATPYAIKVYVNGAEAAIGSSGSSNTMTGINPNIRIGSNFVGGITYLNSNIASVSIYNRALSSTEVLQNYNATKKRFSPEENILTNGLVLYLDAGNARSYAGTGNTAYSISGIGYTGTLVNGSAFSSSNGGAFVLDGTNDFISAPIDASLFSTEATMIIWLKNLNATPAAAANSGFLGYGQGQVNDHYPYVNGVAYLSTFRNIRIEAIPLSSTINRAMPHMVTVTTNSTNWRLYQNTTLQYTDTSVGTVYLSRYTIGYSIDNFFYQGNVYAFMIYNRALTASEIEQNYNALKGRYGLS